MNQSVIISVCVCVLVYQNCLYIILLIIPCSTFRRNVNAIAFGNST